MKSPIKIFVFILLIFLNLNAQQVPNRLIQYRPGDWISYPVMRFMTSVAVGYEYIYFGSTYGIGRYNHFSAEWERPWTVSDGLPHASIQLLAFDRNTGYLWCVTDAGVSYYLSTAEEWRTLSKRDIGADQISSIGIGENYIWLDSGNRIYKGNNLGSFFFESTMGEANGDVIYWAGELGEQPPVHWDQFFTEPGYFLDSRGVIQDQEMRRYRITAKEKDDFEKLWVATWGMGAAAADTRSWDFTFLPYGPRSNNVHAMAWDDDGMWIGGLHSINEPGGITWWNMEDDAWTYFEAPFLMHLRSDAVTTIAADYRFVWFGTDDGLARYDKEQDAWRTFSAHQNLWDDRITSLALQDTILWVGTESGINRILLPGVIIEQVRDRRLIHRFIHWIEPDGEFVWVGTDMGIYRYHRNSKKWDYMTGYAGMVRPEVTAISAWEDEVWFGTSQGVAVYHKSTDEWEGYPAVHYPTEGPIYNILADSANVWVGTGDGVLKLNKNEKRFRRFTVNDGLLANPVHWILLDGDTIWFGTGLGLSRFYWNAPHRID